MEVLISKALIDSYISYDEFVSVNNALRGYHEMKEEISLCANCKKNVANENSSLRKTKQSRSMLLLNCAICAKKISFH